MKKKTLLLLLLSSCATSSVEQPPPEEAPQVLAMAPIPFRAADLRAANAQGKHYH